jgi:DNA polymerase IV (DinB-like DNA polymerase)
MDRVILHVDLDAFYASVEEREDPSLRGKPVVVCMFSARGDDSGAVAASNYIAREKGIRSGMSIKRAKKLEPDAFYLPARRDFYSAVSEGIMDNLRRFADAFEQVSIDEAFLDVSESSKEDFQQAIKIANRIKRDVKRIEKITCSIGIGPNKLIAKMAASTNKPDGLTVVEPGDLEAFLNPLDVSKLWGVGAKTKKTLAEIGVEKIGDLKKIGSSRLIEIFGKSRGMWLYRSSRGIDEEAVVERGEREQIGRITTLAEDSNDLETVLKSVDNLAAEVHKKVRERGWQFRTITFQSVTDDMKGHTRSRTLSSPTDEQEAIEVTVRELVKVFLMENDRPIRRAGIRVSNFREPSGQKTLLSY